jgi:hypothetical protein
MGYKWSLALSGFLKGCSRKYLSKHYDGDGSHKMIIVLAWGMSTSSMAAATLESGWVSCSSGLARDGDKSRE